MPTGFSSVEISTSPHTRPTMSRVSTARIEPGGRPKACLGRGGAAAGIIMTAGCSVGMDMGGAPFVGLRLAAESGSQRLTPQLELTLYLGTRAARSIGQPYPQAVFLLDLILRQNPLKVPGRIGGLLLLIQPAAAGRVREANAL